MTRPVNAPFRTVLLLLAATAAVWGVTLGFGFVWDDLPTVVTNPSLQRWATLWQAFGHDFWGLHDVPAASGYWRPLPTVLYTVVAKLFGLSPVAFHAVNLLLHLSAVVLAFRLFLRLEIPAAGGAAAALFFALHPIHAEAVSFVSALPDLVSAVAGLGFLLLWLRGDGVRETVVGLLFLSAALLSKESAMIFPAAWGVLAGWNRSSGKRAVLARVSAVLGLLAAYGAVHAAVTGGLGTRPLWGGSLDRHLGSALRALALGLSLACVPWKTTPTRTLPLSEGFADPWAWVGLLAVVGLSVCAWAGWRRRRAPALACALFLVFWAPVSNLVPAEGLIADRYLYLPVIGPALAVGAVLGGPLPRVAAAVLLAGWGGWAAASALPWRSEESLWRHASAVSPRSTLAWNALGKVELDAGRFEAARAAFDRALALAPGDRDARINSAVLDLKMASPDGAAVRRLSAHLLDDPNDAAAWDLLASALEAEGATGDALRASERAAHLEPANWKFRFNLGTSLLKAGRSDEAREILRAARELAPGRPEIRLNLAAAELAAGDLGAAKATYRDILGRWPGEPRATAALARLGGSGEDMAGH